VRCNYFVIILYNLQYPFEVYLLKQQLYNKRPNLLPIKRVEDTKLR
jgi:hypothetical protein